MAFDALLKRWFTLVVLGLVAVMAYFQASGATQLLGAALGAGEGLTAPPAAPQPPDPMAASGANKSAEPILDRNPFDSVTGPLNATPIPVPEARSTAPDISDPLSAPACDGLRVAIITESPDPQWSLAAIQGPGEPKPTIRRVGDTVGGSQIAYIGYNSKEQSPSVWATSGPSLCQALLFAAQPAPTAAPKATPTPTPGKPAGASRVPSDIASKIQKVSDTEFNVDRSVVDKILENQAELMRSARIVPEQQNGKVVGIRLFGVAPDSLLGTLGLQNGDRLEAINGFNMSSPEKALEAYARLRTAPNLNVKINRRGQSMGIDFHIK
ncbi:MAG: general secretion pathway protein GspC [Sorangiineae bacterium]|nr:general secretion pathway protein GspC [Polyangiaceae bacterium]MEB2321912.1 general secretion pathway protein GspC [Sorangiineae bacterium]